jgi:hypothetical protein
MQNLGLKVAKELIPAAVEKPGRFNARDKEQRSGRTY